MGKKGSWFSIVKKTLSSDSKEKKEKKPQKPKKRWFGKQKNVDEAILVSEKAKATILDSTSSLPRPPPALKVVKLTEPTENEHSKLANTVVSATAKAAEAASAVFRFLHPAGKSTEEIAAIKIQAVFRGYMERKASRAWRGLVRLRLLIRGQSVQRQTNTTLCCMQTLVRVQTQIRAKRIRLSKENQAFQRQLQQKREKDIEVQRKHDKDIEQVRASTGDNWENSAQSKDQVEANQQYKQEAAKRRERALAYAYSQQQTRNLSSRNTIQALIDPTTPSWGWSWLERWMTARPLETKCGSEKDAKSDCSPSLKSTPIRPVSVGQLSRVNSCGDLNLDIKLSTTTTTSLKQSQGQLSSGNHDLDIKPSTSTTTSQKQSQGRLSYSNLNLGIKRFSSTTSSLKQSQGRLSSSNLDIKLSTSNTTSQKQSQGRLSSSNLDLDIKPSASTTTSLKQSQGRLSSTNLDVDIKPSTGTTISQKQSQGRLSSTNLDLDIKPSASTTSSAKQIQSRSRAATRNSFPHSKIAPVSSVTGLPTSRPRSQKSSEFDGDGDLSNPINKSDRKHNSAESAVSNSESPGNLSRSPTRAPKSRTTRRPSPLGLKSGSRGASAIAEKPTGLLKKRISFSGPRKQSGSAKMDGGTLKDIRVDA